MLYGWLNFGQSTASGSGADHVPEPTTLLLVLLALAAVPLRVRHSGHGQFALRRSAPDMSA